MSVYDDDDDEVSPWEQKQREEEAKTDGTHHYHHLKIDLWTAVVLVSIITTAIVVANKILALFTPANAWR